jgi:hypothetical protein
LNEVLDDSEIETNEDIFFSRVARPFGGVSYRFDDDVIFVGD